MLELLAILPVVYKANKYRSGNDSAFDEAVVASRKTGEPKPPEGERRVFRMNVWVTLGAIAAAYILAKIICG